VTGVPGTIDVQLRDLAQLFNSFDPSPFHERDLDPRAEEFIVSWAREFPKHATIRIVLHLPDAAAQGARQPELARSIAHYFSERADLAGRELREELRQGVRYTGAALPVLTLCLALSQVAGNALPAEGAGSLVEESLIILGWVASWKAIETLLYDWQPVKRRRDLYRRLANAEVVIGAAKDGTLPDRPKSA
jgi:hypothetical protein